MTTLSIRIRTALVGAAAVTASLGAAAFAASPATAASATFWIAPTPPKLNYVVCDSYHHRMTLDIAPGTVTQFATWLQIQDTRTGLWYDTGWFYTSNTGSIDTARFLNIRGTFNVKVYISYLDASGSWQWAYSGWAPTMDSYGPNMDATCTIT